MTYYGRIDPEPALNEVQHLMQRAAGDFDNYRSRMEALLYEAPSDAAGSVLGALSDLAASFADAVEAADTAMLGQY